MTNKEKIKMTRLELENKELRERLDKSMDIYREQALELIDLRTRLEMVRMALEAGE